MLRKLWFGLIGLVALSSVALIISGQFSRPVTEPADNLVNNQQPVNQSEADLPTATSVSPMLAQVQPAIKLPTDSEFIVSGGSATATIRFIEGSIKPLDVHVGDTQNFRIVVTSPNGIKRVVAEIETDNGTGNVELTREGLVGIMDTYPNPYTVNPEDNTLQILNNDQLVQARLDEQQRDLARQKTNQANAAAGQREVWTGSWVVKDVHDKTYFTNFIAYDSTGNQDKLTMTWSDLCNIPLGGRDWRLSEYTASNTCAILNTTDGVDNGDIILDDGKILNLQAAGNFIWTPGYRVKFETGQLILAANKASQLKQGYLYVADNDGDRYSLPTALSAQTSTSSTTPPTGYARRNILIGTTDCYDHSNQAMPGNTIYRSTPFANEVTTTPALFGYDWDCDGSVVVNPDYNKACDSPTTISKYNYKSCTGFDIGGCCGSGGGSGCVGSGCTQARGYNFWQVKLANADEVGCCDGLQSLNGCSALSLVTIGNSSCGQNRNIAWRTSYSNSAGCVGTTYDFYRFTYGGVGCK